MRIKAILSYLDSDRIYNKLNDIRRSKKLTIYQLAKAANVSYSTIYKWRDNKSSPSLYLLESLCDVLEIDIINLLVKEEDLVRLSDEEKNLYDIWKTLNRDQKIAIMALAEALNKENQKGIKTDTR